MIRPNAVRVCLQVVGSACPGHDFRVIIPAFGTDDQSRILLSNLKLKTPERWEDLGICAPTIHSYMLLNVFLAPRHLRN